jgi:hypothetical protein
MWVLSRPHSFKSHSFTGKANLQVPALPPKCLQATSFGCVPSRTRVHTTPSKGCSAHQVPERNCLAELASVDPEAPSSTLPIPTTALTLQSYSNNCTSKFAVLFGRSRVPSRQRRSFLRDFATQERRWIPPARPRPLPVPGCAINGDNNRRVPAFCKTPTCRTRSRIRHYLNRREWG